MAKIKSRKLSSPFLIGLFVLLGSAIMVGTIIWLGANQFLKERNYYVSYFNQSIQGLDVGSPVKYQGVNCGNINEINIAPDGKLVEVVMQIDPKVKINEHMVVKLMFAGLAGGKYIELHYAKDGADISEIPELNFKAPYQVIPTTASGFEEMTLAAEEVVNRLKTMEFKRISDNINKFLESSTEFLDNEELYTIVSDLSESSARLNSILEQADTSKAIANITETSAQLLETAHDIDIIVDSLGTQINEMNLPGYMTKIYAQYDTAMTTTNNVINMVGFRSENVLFSLTETFEELRETNKALQKTLRSITDNPSQVFLSEPPPPEK